MRNWQNPIVSDGIMIIDFHTHTFPARISARVVDSLSKKALIHPFTGGSRNDLLSSMEKAAIDYSVNLPVMTDINQVEKLNTGFIEQKDDMMAKGIIPFGGLHPDFKSYSRELKRLKKAGIAGVKLHPAYQGIDLDDIRTMRILDAASQEGLIVLIHAGVDIGIYDHNYSSVSQVLTVLREVGPDKLVLAHFGNWGCWDQVESDLAGAPVWFDTAFSLGPILSRSETEANPAWTHNLSDQDFLRIARKHGTDKILFATDSPWADQKDYVDRIRCLDLNTAEKDALYSGNALKLLASAGWKPENSQL